LTEMKGGLAGVRVGVMRCGEVRVRVRVRVGVGESGEVR